jgi:hypothetical protein
MSDPARRHDVGEIGPRTHGLGKLLWTTFIEKARGLIRLSEVTAWFCFLL